MDADLLQNVTQIVNDRQAALGFLAYCLAAPAGQVLYAVRLWLGHEIDGVLDRFRHDARATVLALLGNIAAIGGAAMLVPFAATPWQVCLLLGLWQGMSADSALNRSARKAWTPEEREAAVRRRKADDHARGR